MSFDPEATLDAPQLLRSLREQKGWSQDKVERESEKLDKSEGFVTVTQSTLGVIESRVGKALRPEIIRTLAHLYEVDPDPIFAAYAHQRYALSGAKSKVLSRQIRDIDELADWERERHVMELWVFAPQFVDPDNTNIRDAVISILARNGEVTYFTYYAQRVTDYIEQLDLTMRLAEKDAASGSSTGTLSIEKLERMSFVFLPIDSFHLPTSFVVSNPTARLRQTLSPRNDGDVKSHAYIVLTKETRPEIGIEVNDDAAVVDYIRRLLRARDQKRYTVPELLRMRGTDEKPEPVVYLHGVRNEQR